MCNLHTVGKKDAAEKAVHSVKTAEDQVIFDYEDLKITAELGDFDAQAYSVPVEIENNTGKDLTITSVIISALFDFFGACMYWFIPDSAPFI